jgi:site-specific recombinase XerC
MMRDLNYELKQLCHRNRDGSYATQHDRERVLDQIADQLQELGFRHMVVAGLKPKHVEGLVERWKADGLAVGTIKNRMAELRWWAEKIGKQNVVARDNDHYGIGHRQYVTNVSKARELTAGDLAKIADPYTRMSLQLQAAFGLRRGESIKVRPEWADRGDKLVLKDTWTKGGREREIPIRNEEQRRVLDEAKRSFRPTSDTWSSSDASSTSAPGPVATGCTDIATSMHRLATGNSPAGLRQPPAAHAPRN